MVADQGEAGGLQVAIGGDVRIAGQQPVDLRQALGRLLLQEQGVGEVEADRRAVRRELQGVGEQHLGVGPAPLLQIDAAKQGQGVRVRGPLQQMGPQPRLSGVKPAVADIDGGRLQQRRRDGGPGEFEERLLGPGGIALEEQQIAQGAPGLRKVGIERHRQPQGLGGGRAGAQEQLDCAQFILGVGGAGKGPGQGGDDRQRRCGLSLAAQGGAQDQQQPRVLRRASQQAPGVLLRAAGILGQAGGGLDHAGGEGVCGRDHASGLHLKGAEGVRISVGKNTGGRPVRNTKVIRPCALLAGNRR